MLATSSAPLPAEQRLLNDHPQEHRIRARRDRRVDRPGVDGVHPDAARRQFKRGDLNALDPSAPVHVPCLVVLPVTGPVGPVPNL
jgi:hypothetical protein